MRKLNFSESLIVAFFNEADSSIPGADVLRNDGTRAEKF